MVSDLWLYPCLNNYWHTKKQKHCDRNTSPIKDNTYEENYTQRACLVLEFRVITGSLYLVMSQSGLEIPLMVRYSFRETELRYINIRLICDRQVTFSKYSDYVNLHSASQVDPLTEQISNSYSNLLACGLPPETRFYGPVIITISTLLY